jgi:hypothetical protein
VTKRAEMRHQQKAANAGANDRNGFRIAHNVPIP